MSVWYLPLPQDSRASHPTLCSGTTGVRKQLQKLWWHGHYFCVSVLHYIPAQSTGLQIKIIAWLMFHTGCRLHSDAAHFLPDLCLCKTDSVNKSCVESTAQHGLKNTFKPPVRDIFRGRRVEMAFGTSSKPIFSTNIWLTGFHCTAILSFLLILSTSYL